MPATTGGEMFGTLEHESIEVPTTLSPITLDLIRLLYISILYIGRIADYYVESSLVEHRIELSEPMEGLVTRTLLVEGNRIFGLDEVTHREIFV